MSRDGNCHPFSEGALDSTEFSVGTGLGVTRMGQMRHGTVDEGSAYVKAPSREQLSNYS